jgi:ectoine hydroxylase-related dioxygenase (phytanoyl-CoA dioxygenase family)
MTLLRVPAAAPHDLILDAYQTAGGIVVEDIFAAKTIDALRQDLTTAAESFAPGVATQGLGPGGKTFTGANTLRFSSLGKVSEAFFDLLENKVYADLADAVLLPNCGSYWINTGQAMFIGPGEPTQMLHRDCENWDKFCAPQWPHCPEITISAMIPLDEFTADNGATRLIPGSHTWADFSDRGKPEMSQPAIMKPGDALIYSGKLLHGGGANQTSSSRRALHLSFLAGWLVPEESSPLDYTDDELNGRSDRIRRLLGHSSYDPRPYAGGAFGCDTSTRLKTPRGFHEVTQPPTSIMRR